MKKRRFFIVTFALIGVAIFWRWALPNREPRHNGEPISYWVNRACEYGADYEKEIRAIGAPAVPYLVEKLTIKDDPLRDAVSSLRQSLPAPLQRLVPFVARSDMVRWRAAWALSWLGSKAKPAVPDLARLLSDPLRAEISMAWALRAIGPEAGAAIPSLHIALMNQDPHLRIDAAWAIWSIAKDTNLVLRVCTNAIMTKQADIGATWVLCDLGPAAIETAPLLLHVLQDTNRSERLRSTAAFALGSMKTHTQEITSALVASSEDEEPLVRVYSSAALWKMDSQYISIAVPRIVEGILALVGTQYQEGGEDYVQFVEHLELDPKISVPFLNELLEHGSPKVGQAAREALQRIDSKPIVKE